VITSFPRESLLCGCAWKWREFIMRSVWTVMLFSDLVSVSMSACGAAATAPATAPSAATDASRVDFIFWENQSWMSNGPSARLTLWSNGHSEILVRSFGKTRQPKSGWTVEQDEMWAQYRKADPYPADEVKHKISAALAAGIQQLRTFRPGYRDGSGTLVGVQVNGNLTETSIPMFIHPGQPDNAGSENHKRFLEIEKILGDFDTKPVEPPASQPVK
jgi:hypothetical protein